MYPLYLPKPMFSPADGANSQRPLRASLQMRLTLGAIAAIWGGLGLGMLWMSWRTERMFLADHRAKLSAVVQQMPDQEVAIAHGSASQSDLQDMVNRLSSASTWLWIRDNNGDILARSNNLQVSENQDALLELSETTPTPKILRLQGQFIIWCTYPLEHSGQIIGQLYVAQDVTRDYSMLQSVNRDLMMGTGMGVVTMSGLAAWLIWRSLSPLRQANQIAEAYSAGSTSISRLDPKQVPVEVQELVHTCNRLVDRLSQTAEQQRQFTNDVSHELRTPLSLVYGYLQSTLRRSPNLTEAQQEMLSMAVSETERTIELLQGLLELARTDSSAVLFNLEPVAIGDVVDDVIRMTEQFKQRSLKLETPSQPIVARADREHLLRVLVHLIDNAIQYSEPHQPISLTLSRRAPWALIQVRDRGCGIPKEDQARIFESFYRVDASRSRATGGVGLGLAIAKSLVEGMGGQISVESTLGVGSVFTVKLPLLE
ncbi:Signal transduction histidine-protein kinase ArlS [Leptolyngbya sp. O-77]|nr:Signal transduction histidine-protein kinase ArlS [Leptolyngbya sp. O-77]